MRSKTVKENFGYRGTITVKKGIFKQNIELYSLSDGRNVIIIDLSTKRARELFEAGLQMCDELEQEGK